MDSSHFNSSMYHIITYYKVLPCIAQILEMPSGFASNTLMAVGHDAALQYSKTVEFCHSAECSCLFKGIREINLEMN